MFSNFRDRIERAGPAAVARFRRQARDIERQAGAAVLAVRGRGPETVSGILDDFSRSIYLSCVQAMRETKVERRIEADRLTREVLLIDTHMDTPWQLQKKMADLSVENAAGHFDGIRARQGGLDAAFWAIYVPPEQEERGQAKAFADETIDMVEKALAQWPRHFVQARSPDELRSQTDDERVSILLAIENGAPIEGNLGNLRHFYDRGVRYITLAHSRNNHICDSSYDDGPTWHGLSPFGRELVAAMNRLGMVIDVSHVSDEAFYQVLELSRAPVVATHSSCRHFTPGWQRNMSDDMIRRLADKGGVIQINFGSIFVSPRVNAEFTALQRDIRRQIEARGLQGAEKDGYVEQRWKAARFSTAGISDVVAHIDHVVGLVGVDHVGLGSDFDGVEELPEGLEDVSCYPNLVFELLERGYTRQAIRCIAGENFLRVWSEVRAAAASQ
jgi:membrane dipeptidase